MEAKFIIAGTEKDIAMLRSRLNEESYQIVDHAPGRLDSPFSDHAGERSYTLNFTFKVDDEEMFMEKLGHFIDKYPDCCIFAGLHHSNQSSRFLTYAAGELIVVS